MTKQGIKSALANYCQTPKLISEKLEIIRNCETEREKFSPKSAQVSGLPHGNEISDRTYADAMEGRKYFDEEIRFHRENIIRLQNQQRQLRDALQVLTPIERKIVEKAYMTPDGRKVPWKVVATEIGYSESRLKDYARSAMRKLENFKAGENNGDARKSG